MYKKNYFHKLAYLSLSLLLSFTFFSPSFSAKTSSKMPTTLKECQNTYCHDNAGKRFGIYKGSALKKCQQWCKDQNLM